jgi:hypothetical protein
MEDSMKSKAKSLFLRVFLSFLLLFVFSCDDVSLKGAKGDPGADGPAGVDKTAVKPEVKDWLSSPDGRLGLTGGLRPGMNGFSALKDRRIGIVRQAAR